MRSKRLVLQQTCITYIFALLTLVATPPFVQAETKSVNNESGSRVVFLVRHAEKRADQGKDPELTAIGLRRAKALASLMSSEKLSAIYSTQYQRTLQTALPSAQRLKLETQHYDPRKLEEFAQKILSTKGNLLIVGHSNTTPMLTHLLGGRAHGAIDESEYDRVYQLTFNEDGVDTQILRSTPIQNRLPQSVFKARLSNLRDHELKYQMLLNKNLVGYSTHVIKQGSNHLSLVETTTVKKMNIDATIKLTVDKKSFAPISMKMTGNMGNDVNIEFNWQDNSIEGHSKVARSAFETQGKIDLKADYSPKTLERSSAIMLAHLAAVKPKKPFAFEWFDAYTGRKRLITVSHQGTQTIEVPAGTFETDIVRYQGGAPSQLFYVSREEIPKVVRIDVISMPWRYELVESKN